MASLLLVESNSTGTGRLFARRARELGVEPVLLAADTDRYPYAGADGVPVLRVDTSDPDAVRAAAGPSVVGVTTSSEYYLPVAAEVAAALGLPGPAWEAVDRCRDKANQRRDASAHGLPVPGHVVASTVAEAVAGADLLGWPVVVKPVTGSGSVGVRRCAGRAEVAGHTGRLLATTVNERGLPVPGRVLVEQHVAGPEYSVEVFGDTVVAVVAKHLGPPPHFVEVGHDLPADVPGGDGALRALALQALRAMGLGFGAAHVEIRLAACGPVLVEVNPRLAGGMIPELVRAATGVDLVAAQVAAATGAPVTVAATRSRHASLRFLTVDEPAVLAENPVAAVLDLPHVVAARLDRRPGDRLTPARDFRDRAGHVLTAAADAGTARTAAAAAVTRLRHATRTGVH
jgi:argininosuccinate lyase